MKQRLKNPRVGDVVYSLLSGKGVIKSIDEELIVLFDNGGTKYYTLDGRYRPTHQNSELSYTPWFGEDGVYTASFEKPIPKVEDMFSLREFLKGSQRFPFDVLVIKDNGDIITTHNPKECENRISYCPNRMYRKIITLKVFLTIREFMLTQAGYENWCPSQDGNSIFYTIRHCPTGKEKYLIQNNNCVGGILTFPTKELAEKFLENNEYLLENIQEFL